SKRRSHPKGWLLFLVGLSSAISSQHKAAIAAVNRNSLEAHHKLQHYTDPTSSSHGLAHFVRESADGCRSTLCKRPFAIAGYGELSMQTKRIIWSYVLIAVCGTAFFFNDASAATLVKDCGWCTSTAQASSHAQGHAYNLNSGNHTIFIVNLNNTTKAWKFEVKVAVTGPGFGEKTVTILSSQAAPASVTNSLNQMKATGLR